MQISAALKGITGTFEINRCIGAFGASVYIIGANAFMAWSVYHRHPFNLTEYCLAFPSGLAACLGATSAACHFKDRGVAAATAVFNQANAAAPAPPIPTAASAAPGIDA